MSASEIPSGVTLEVVFDRMQRARNFASTGRLLGEGQSTDRDRARTARTYIHAAATMLEEALQALEGVEEALTAARPASTDSARV